MEHIAAHKDAVPGFQRDALLTHLILQYTGRRRGDLKLRMPVQRPHLIRQQGQLILEIADRECGRIVGHLLPQLMIQYDGHGASCVLC